MLSGRPSLQTIYTRILSDIQSRLDGKKKIGKFSFYGIIAVVFAGAIHICYGFLYKFIDQLFYDSAEREYLIKLAYRRGINVKSATFSSGRLNVFGEEGTEITESFIFRDSAGIEYSPSESYIIPEEGEVIIDISSNVEGTVGNTRDSVLTLDLNSIGDLDPDNIDVSAPIHSGLNNGADEESTSSIRNRIAISYSVPPAGGRDSDYELWALEIPGIDFAWTKPTFAGAGTVGVVVSDINKLTPTLFALQSAQNNIQNKKPSGVSVVVSSVLRRRLDIVIAISPNTLELRQNVRGNLDSLFDGLSIPGEKFYLNSIMTSIGQSGLSNYEILSFNLDGESIPIGDIEMPNYRSYLFLADVDFVGI
jgi:uncharacterized phage protein gp47/JayE